MADTFAFSRAETTQTALGQDGNDLLIVNNGDGSDFLETSLEAAGLEVVVAAATTEMTGGEDIDTLKVNGADPVAATDDVWIDGNIITAEDYDSAREAAGLEVIVAAATTETTRPEPAIAHDADIVGTPAGRESADGAIGLDVIIGLRDLNDAGSASGIGNDFVQVNGANGAGDDVSIDPFTGFDGVLDIG